MENIQRIGILGATSQIAKDLIISFSTEADKFLHLFARTPHNISNWLKDQGLSNLYLVDDFLLFSKQEFDVIINFVGVGDPRQATLLGPKIIDITLQYDELALNYLSQHPSCRYIFISSGAAMGNIFDLPARVDSQASFNLNSLAESDWYGIAKFIAECRHRSYAHLKIVDLRVFNYFSRSHNINSNFLISDILRAVLTKTELTTSRENILRDFLHPQDFKQLISKLIESPDFGNQVFDCYTKNPVSKFSLLENFKLTFGLQYRVLDNLVSASATGSKFNYYSLNQSASKIGYSPKFTSLDGILEETRAILRNP
jgi:nucleoside-diphosphate-sugar epimerase